MITRLILTATIALAAGHGPAQTAPEDPLKALETGNPVYTKVDRASQDLKAHGIGLSENELIAFLRDGIPASSKFPPTPPEKSQLIIDAMAALAQLRSKAAVPVLIRLARFDTTLKSFSLIDYDLQNTSPQAKDEFRLKAYRLVQYNAINAISLIGQPDPAAIDLIRAVMQQEKSLHAQIQYALCLATLGDPSGVDYLIQIIAMENRKESAAAAKVFYFITGQDLGYTENTPIRRRKSLPGQYRQWWTQHRASFAIDREAVRKRRLAGTTARNYTPRSTRDLIKSAANYFDFNNKDKAVQSRDKLVGAGTSLNKEYEQIAMDPMEDLDVRIEALNLYFSANRPADPLDLFRRLRRDENPEVAQKAENLIQQLADDANLLQSMP